MIGNIGAAVRGGLVADPFDLQRFEKAQADVYPDVVAELGSGAKRTHWMWFVFPQLRGLGRSATAKYYGIGSRGEAVAYLAHPSLGVRLRECARLVTAVDGRSAEQIMGHVDAVKLKSSMTLFAAVSEGDRDFVDVLDKFYDGEQDSATIGLLSGS
jgi:uncharacterized protein (DUF1810 family)